MVKEFEKVVLFDNIAYLLKENDMKVGELETKAGVSVGYISRTKEGNAKPGIDFIMKVASILNVSLDALLTTELKALTPTEKYLVTFLEKLIRDTGDDKLYWNVEKFSSLNRLLGPHGSDYGKHPLFNEETFYYHDESNYPQEYSRIVFHSKSFEPEDTVIADDCYNLEMKNGTTLYVMDIGNYDPDLDAPSHYDTELWMTAKTGTKQYLCHGGDSSYVGDLVVRLKATIKANLQHPKMRKEFMSVIDAFLNDDMEDGDDKENLPF